MRRQTLYDAPIELEVERERRDTPYGAPAPYAAPVHHGPKGKVGPVYTFVKTDPKVSPELLSKFKRGFSNDHFRPTSSGEFATGPGHSTAARLERGGLSVIHIEYI